MVVWTFAAIGAGLALGIFMVAVKFGAGWSSWQVIVACVSFMMCSAGTAFLAFIASVMFAWIAANTKDGVE
jgi:hypothetical protein